MPPGAAGGAAAGAAGGGAVASGAATGGSAGSAAAGNAPSGSTAAQRFGVAVGTYLNEERADQERVKLVASTSLPARVVTVTEDDVAMYRLVMGAFESRQSAERMASSLIERGLVDEARVVQLSATTPSKP
jgi:cell division protein FtsN